MCATCGCAGEELAGHVHEDALGIAVPIAVPAVPLAGPIAGPITGPATGGKPVVVAALSAIVPVTSDSKAVTAVLAAAARGIGRTLRRTGP